MGGESEAHIAISVPHVLRSERAIWASSRTLREHELPAT